MKKLPSNPGLLPSRRVQRMRVSSRRGWRRLSSTGMALGLVWIVVSCGGYGRIEDASRHGVEMDALAARWNDMAVYYTLLPGEKPGALLFDPQDDGRRIDAPRWRRIHDQQSLAEILDFLRTWSRPRLYALSGPEGRVFGYVYYGYDHPYRVSVTSKLTDARTLRVYDLYIQTYAPP